MVHLEVRNKPPATGKELIHRNIVCLAFDYNVDKKELAIYETYEDYVNNIPSYSFCYVTRIIYWNENQEVI